MLQLHPLGRLLLQIIPSQWILAISRFAVRWTADVTLDDRTDAILDYLRSEHNWIKGVKNLRGLWEKWIRTETELKKLMFFERIGMLSQVFFEFRGEDIEKTHPFLYFGAIRAFEPKYMSKMRTHLWYR